MNEGKERTLNWSAIVGALVTVITLVSGALAIKQYYLSNPRHDITGSWTIETHTVDTSYSHFKDMDLTYTVQFIQDGSNFRGTGEKTTENGREVMGKAHTPIKIIGTIKGDSIDASFTEDGTERESHGEFHWKLKDGAGAGTFMSTAANSSGSSSLTAYNAGGS